MSDDREMLAKCELTLALNLGPDGDGPLPHPNAIEKALAKLLEAELELPGGTVCLIEYAEFENLEVTVE